MSELCIDMLNLLCYVLKLNMTELELSETNFIFLDFINV